MKVSRFKPTDSGHVRIELDVSYNDIISAQHFQPEATELRDEDGHRVFKLDLAEGTSSYAGNKGFRVSLPEDEKRDEKVQVILQIEEPSEAALIGLVVRQKNNLTKIEKQIKKAVAELKKAQEEIEEA